MWNCGPGVCKFCDNAYTNTIMSIKTFLITAWCIISVLAVHAQYIGLKGGLNLSEFNIDQDKLSDEKLRTGYHFGAFLQLPLSDGFALQPEVLYSTKGTRASYVSEDSGFTGDIDYKLDYIDVPLLGVLKLGDLAEIHLGPYFGFTSSTKIDRSGSELEDEQDFDKEFIKSLDYGLVVGAALNFGMFNLGARYNYGLQKIENSEIADVFIGNATNRNFQFFGALRIGNYD